MQFHWGRRARSERSTRPHRGKRRHVEFLVLEQRQLQVVGLVTAVAIPKILPGNNGRLVAVTVTGKVEQVINTLLPGHQTTAPPQAQLDAIDAHNAARPGPGIVQGIVTDQYRRVEPRVQATLGPVVSNRIYFIPASLFVPQAIEGVARDYTYTFTVYLQAKSSSIGRQYDVTVFAKDSEGGNQTTIGAATAHGLHLPSKHHRGNQTTIGAVTAHGLHLPPKHHHR